MIAVENTRRGINSDTIDYWERDYFGTTGATLSIKDGEAELSYIGDGIVLFIPKEREAELLTRDQLHGCNSFSVKHFGALMTKEQLIWQRSFARNNKTAIDSEGNSVGFGAFTGEQRALDFLESVVISVKKGDKFVLSTDALRVLSEAPQSEEESIGSYQGVINIIKNTPKKELPKKLIQIIRKEEVRKKARSDDATIVVVEVE
jgi:serine/threonine protein phosphatase PrpC